MSASPAYPGDLRITRLRAQRDEARSSRDACLSTLSHARVALAQIERIEALAEEWECEPGGSDYHRAACPGCRRADQVRVALGGSA